MKPINIKIMMALIEKEPGDQYVPVLKPVLMQILTELKHLRRKNSQLGGKLARLRRKDTPMCPVPDGYNECDDVLCPNCHKKVGCNDMEEYEENEHCHHCGQRLKWY